MTERKTKKYFSFSNIFTGVLLVLVMAMVAFPEVKALFIRGLMQIGLFKPDIPKLPSKGGLQTETDNNDLLLYDENGASIDVGTLKGKVVFINFWATWCPPCIAEMPSIAQLYKKFKTDTGVVFLIVEMDGNREKANGFLKSKNIDLPLSYPRAAIPTRLFTGSLPTTVVLDRAGNIVMKEESVADYSGGEFEKFINELKTIP